MRELEYSAVCREIIERVGEVSADEEVVIVTDSLMIEIARPLAAAARATGAPTSVLVKPRLAAHNVEPPAAVAGAIRNADVVFDAGTHDLAHTDARRAASDAGTRFVFMRGISEAVMIDQMDTDYDALRTVTRAVAAIQTAAESARVTSGLGTDLTVDLTGRSGVPVDDGFDAGLVVLPAGKSAITPVEGSAQGTVVVDYSIDNLGRLDDPIELTVEDGRVSDVSGGSQATELRALIDHEGECARNVAEAPSIGTNPDVSLTGNQGTDKKKRGTMHVAIGDNVTLGGTVDCGIHLDMTLLDATVAFDGFRVLEEGRFRTEAVMERAAELETR
ncbi:aminopeptidase [Halalkalicoccus salilacus]|uniref:aminopeptidase n=1 Tax=Halalkalicoccus salilacus TaxID=3117459 RepID=UPI00300EC747